MVPVHLVVKAVLGRGPMARVFLKGAGWIMGLRVTRHGGDITPQTLFLANHVSWLDILVMGGWGGCAFVSKAEVQEHWLIKFLADQRETLYIDRQARRSVPEQIAAIRRRFDHYLPLAVFPEGTTSDGSELLPFRPSLLAAVAPAPDGTRVRPAAIDYGEDATFVGWKKGEPGTVNARRILSRWRPIRVDLHLLPPLAAQADRKALARTARTAIGERLQLGGSFAPREAL